MIHHLDSQLVFQSNNLLPGCQHKRQVPLYVQLLWSTHSYFQGSSRQQLPKGLIYMHFLCKKSGTRFARSASGKSSTQIFHVLGFLGGCSSSPSITMTTPSKTPTAPGKPSPAHQVCVFSLESLHCVVYKKTGHFCSKIFPGKVHFCMHDRLCFMLALSFSLQTSIMMTISTYGKDCLLFYYQGVSSRNGMVAFVEMVYSNALR